MTKKNLIIMATAMLCISAISWMPINKKSAADTSMITKASTAYYLPWEYVMDWRYGRTCSPGGGVCFKNGDGDVFEYWNYMVAPGDVPGDDVTDAEVGPMYLRIENARLHVIFCRSVEGNTFDVDEPVRFRDELLQALGAKFALKPGNYRVDFSRYKDYGESWIDIKLDQ